MAFVVDGDGEAAAERRERAGAAFLVEVDDQLRIVPAGERMALLEARAELAPVVHRAREDGVHRPALVAGDGNPAPVGTGVRQYERPSRGVDGEPRPRRERLLGPAEENAERASHGSVGPRVSSTSPCTTASRKSSPPARSSATRRNASCSRRSDTGSSLRGTMA